MALRYSFFLSFHMRSFKALRFNTSLPEHQLKIIKDDLIVCYILWTQIHHYGVTVSIPQLKKTLSR